MRKILLGLLLFGTMVSASTLRNSRHQQFLGGLVPRNYVINPGAEQNALNVTIGATMSVTRTTVTPIEGDAEFTVDGAATSDTADWVTNTFQAGLNGQNCLAQFTYEGDASLYTADVRQGSVNIVSQALTNVSVGNQTVQMNFPCGDAGSATVLRIENTGAAGAAFRMDSVYIGLATNLANLAQAKWVGSINWAGTTLCEWTPGNTGNAFTNFPADTDCPAPTVTGSLSTPGTKIPVATLNGAQAGTYYVVMNGRFDAENVTTSATLEYRISDGTNAAGYGIKRVLSTAALDTPVSPVVGTFTYSGPQSSITWQPQGRSTSDSNDPYIINSTTGVGFQIDVYFYPSNSIIAVNAGQAGWKVDASISGANPSLGTSAQTAYVGIEDSGLTLANNSGTGNISAQIGCSSTNAPSGTTCSVGNESVSVAFTPLGVFPQDVLACASFAHNIVTAATGVVNTTFQIIETPTNAQTLSQEGKGRVQDGFNTASSTITFPNRVCGVFTFSSPGQRLLRLMYEQAVTATVTSSLLFADAGANNGQRDIHWEVYPINQGISSPILVNSVTSNGNGPWRVEAADVTCSASSSITTQTGTWLASVGNVSSGLCTLTWSAGAFSAAPLCTATEIASSVTGFNLPKFSSVTSSSASLGMANIASGSSTIAAGTSGRYHIKCMGAR